jgi:hypothetical protein
VTTMSMPVSAVSMGAGQVVRTTAESGYRETMFNTVWRPELAAVQYNGSQMPRADQLPGQPKCPYYWTPGGSSAIDGWIPLLWYNDRPNGRPFGPFRMAGPYVAPGQAAPALATVVPGPR